MFQAIEKHNLSKMWFTRILEGRVGKIVNSFQTNILVTSKHNYWSGIDAEREMVWHVSVKFKVFCSYVLTASNIMMLKIIIMLSGCFVTTTWKSLPVCNSLFSAINFISKHCHFHYSYVWPFCIYYPPSVTVFVVSICIMLDYSCIRKLCNDEFKGIAKKISKTWTILHGTVIQV